MESTTNPNGTTDFTVTTSAGTFTLKDAASPPDAAKAAELVEMSKASGITRMTWNRFGPVTFTSITGRSLAWKFKVSRTKLAIGGGWFAFAVERSS